MQTHPTYPTDLRVDPDELDRHIAEMYRDVANEVVRDLHFPTGRALAEALGYPAELLDRLPPEAVRSFAGVGYHFGLARLLAGERVLDLGSGSGMDVFAAAIQVGSRGSVTGVEQTRPTASRASGHRERATSTARTASRSSRSAPYVIPATPPTPIWVMAPMSPERLRCRL